jgi:dihydroflavonol-4-reductase
MTTTGAAGYWVGRRAAVTGATGFVGRHLALRLVELGARVTALVRPGSDRRRLAGAGVRCAEAGLEDEGGLARACDGCEFLFHLAGAVDFHGDWDRFRRVNVGGTRRALAAAGSAGVRRFVHTSSVVAVGASRRPALLDEASGWDLAALKVPYVTTKRRAEEHVLSAPVPGVEVVVVNPACVVGPGDHSGSEFGTLCRRFWRGRIPFHFGGGNNFVDVRDVAAGHLQAAERGRAGERYILGGENRDYAAFFADLSRAAGRSIFRLRLPDALGGVVAWLDGRLGRGGAARAYLTPEQARLIGWFFYYDCGKARRELGYSPRPLRQSLAEAFAFWTGRKAA